jgi:hypothetical protein
MVGKQQFSTMLILSTVDIFSDICFTKAKDKMEFSITYRKHSRICVFRELQLNRMIFIVRSFVPGYSVLIPAYDMHNDL